ncbi:MAG TPA: MOSC N-terminal beta barrel domain-containing protein [Gammaproteobacteria bacterium]
MSRVTRIFVYPIKSCRGIEVPSAELASRGLKFDRRYMLVDSDGRFLTQRRYPKMALIETQINDGGFTVSAPGRESLEIPFGIDGQTGETCTVRVWADRVEATLADAETNIWFSEFMGFACGLVYLADRQHRAIPNAAAAFDDEVSFADGAPLLLVSDASLAELNRRLPQPVPIERFRPNLVVTADEPHAEDEWRSIRIGAARLDVAWPCSRCVMVTVDPETGAQDSTGEPLRTLEGYRRRDRAVYFGQNLIPRASGTINVGAICAIDEIIES